MAEYTKKGSLPIGVFATYPNEHLSTANGFFDQVSVWILSNA